MVRHARPSFLIPMLAAVVSLVTVPAVSVAAPAGVTVQRIFGADRYATSAAIARATFGTSAVPVGKAVIASGTDFPDAVVGSNLQSGYYGTGPILLTRKHDVPTPIVDVIKALAIHTIWVVGGTAAVDRSAEQRLTSLTSVFGLLGQVTRFSGTDRYTTGASVARTAFDGEANIPAVVDGMRTAFVVSGVAANDGLAVAPLAYALFGSPLQTKFPLLLTQPDLLSVATRDALLSITGGNRPIQQVIVIGGPGTVSQVVLSQIQALGLSARRIEGAGQQSTAVAVANFAIQTLGWNPARVVLARGDDPIDAASAAPFAGEKHSPLLFTSSPDQLGSATTDFLRAHAGTIQNIDVLGGPGAVSDAVIAQARAAVGG
jgi:putative cell wall-binding protein